MEIGKTLGEYETIRINFKDKEEYLLISGNGDIRYDLGVVGGSENIFENAKRLNKDSATLDNSSASNGWDRFQMQSEYIQLLVRVQCADHNVHKELDEAIAKIKELTYQG